MKVHLYEKRKAKEKMDFKALQKIWIITVQYLLGLFYNVSGLRFYRCVWLMLSYTTFEGNRGFGVLEA